MWLGYLYILLLLISETEPYWNYFKSNQLVSNSSFFRVERESKIGSEMPYEIYYSEIQTIQPFVEVPKITIQIFSLFRKKVKELSFSLFHDCVAVCTSTMYTHMCVCVWVYRTEQSIYAKYILIGKTGRDRCTIANALFLYSMR